MRPARRPPPPEEPSFGALVLWLVVVGFVVLPLLQSRHRPPARDPVPRVEAPLTVPGELEETVEAARRALRRDPDAALQLIEDALARADGADPELRARLLEWAASVHERRWHLHKARDALRAAVEAAPTPARRAALDDVEEQIRRNQPERGLAASYHAARGAGPAATLSGRVVVAYLFVDPPGIERWTDPERIRTRATLGRVTDWYRAEAARHGATPPEFVERLFEVPLAAGDLPLVADVDAARRTASLLASNLGHASLGDLLRALADEERADQAMFMVHSPRQGRSFTVYCARRSSCDEEIAILLEPTGGGRWDRLAYAIAHEGLHLFGADDLYDVRGAEDFAPTDLMNYPSARLDHAEVGELTAWAVGWRGVRPETPFDVEE